VLSVIFLVVARDARALDRFEIQVYDGQANDPGVLSLEGHVNFTDRGRGAAAPESATNHQLHWTWEGALGVTPAWEPGVYLQSALLPDGRVRYAGAKLHSKFVAQKAWGRLRLGANFELAEVPREFERDEWSVEIRPIASVDLHWVRVAVNPIVGVPLAHGAYRDGPGFEPAVSFKGVLSERVALGLEYYGDFGPIASPAPAKDQAHYFYCAGDYHLGAGFDLNLGIGYGATGASDPLTFKAIVGYEIARLW
jgi:hypothetical protein